MSAASFPDLLSCQRVWLTGLFIPAPDDSLQSPSGSVGSSAACARQPGESGLTESSHNKHTASQPHRCRVYPYSRRERWFDQNARNTHPWVGARWVSDFDEALKKRKSDSNGAPVQVVEQEDGYKIAAQIIEESPQIVERVWNLINANLVPQGSVARVERAIAINNDALHGRIAQHLKFYATSAITQGLSSWHPLRSHFCIRLQMNFTRYWTVTTAHLKPRFSPVHDPVLLPKWHMKQFGCWSCLTRANRTARSNVSWDPKVMMP